MLNRPAVQSVNTEDCLAQRLDSFCAGKDIQFRAVAPKLNLSSICSFRMYGNLAPMRLNYLR